MTTRLAVVAALAGVAFFLPLRAQSAHRSDAGSTGAATSRRLLSQTVWDSVYTAEQATRGDSLYKLTCVKCHGPELAGGDDGAPLAGKLFLGNWTGLPLNELYEKIRTTMPSDNPKTVPPEQLIDILAFVLSKNSFPAGTKLLTTDSTLLKDIKFLQDRPAPTPP
jgi:mono/diheme cytochrome c family protein